MKKSVLTSLLLLLFPLLALAAPEQASEEPSEFLLFLGRFHPLIVHFPIGLLVVAFMMETAARFPRYKYLQPAIDFVWWVGALGATVAAVLGYLLSLSGRYPEETLFLHQWLGIGVAALAITLALLRMKSRENMSLKKMSMPGMALTVLLLMGAGHNGGNLTHGSDYLTYYMPEGMRKLAGLPERAPEINPQPITNVQEAVVYRDIIHPILDNHCISCHNAGKTKGGLRMDGPEFITRGGKNGEILIAGNPASSEMLKRIHLPLEDDKHMPPDGKEQLNEEQIALLAWWIESGANFEATVAQTSATPAVQTALEGMGKMEKSSEPAVFSLSVAPPPADAVAKLNEFGALAMPIAQESNFLQVSTTTVWQKFGDAEADMLLPLAEQLTWLDLARTQITDAGLTKIGQLKNLSKLHLQQTAVTDEGLAGLEGLEYLEYLNLYGTQVTDAGLEHLKGLKNLRAVYLWQTGVTKEGARALQEALPDLEINMGWDEEDEAKPQA